MTPNLPPRPNLEQLRHQAKDLLRAHRRGDLRCCAALRLLNRFSGAADENILAADVSLQQAQHALALDHGFESWKDLRTHVALSHVRPMTESDDRAVSELVGLCWRQIAEAAVINERQLEAILRERCRTEHAAALRERFNCHVADVGGQIKGFLALSGYSVEELWVRPESQRQGIGAALFQYAEQSANEAGHGKVSVATTRYAVPFYEGCGMRAVGKRTVTFGPLAGEDLILLEKVL